MTASSRCISFADVNSTRAGGKAEGLVTLTALGLRVPDGFVILNPRADALPGELEAAYDRLGRGRVAVRSSASDEDGIAVSFAGQHATVLDVEGVPALRDAITHCINSLASERAQAYRKERADSTNATMSVIVQRMVDARCAGAIFTADPTTARRDRMVVEAVKGTGDALMNGAVTADHFTLTRGGATVKSELLGSEPCVHDDELRALATDALRIEQHVGKPVDCEWAIDRAGTIAWLQARPITALPADPRELDDELNPDDVYSRCNLGEVFPGVATPLTISTSVRAFDEGLTQPWKRIPALEAQKEPGLCFVQFGRLFFNLSFWIRLVRSMPGASNAFVTETICGRAVPEIVPGPGAPRWERIRNAFRYAPSILFTMLFGRHAARLEQILSSVDLTPGATSRETYAKIDRELPKLGDGWFRHTGATMLPGTLIGVLIQFLAKGSQPTAQHSAVMAQVLTGTTDVESVDIAEGINRMVAALIQYDSPQLERFVALDAGEARCFLEHKASAPAQKEYAAYLKRHGHRCILEMELREKEWAEDPTPIVEAVQSGVRAIRAGHVLPSKHEQASAPLLVRMFVRIGRRGIRERETTKSQVILLTTLFRHAYRALARQMVEEGLLPDPDLVFFLQHAELGELLRAPNSRLVEQAFARREVLPYQEKFYFKENTRGMPEPIDPPCPSEEGVVHGKPASLGVVRGRARVVQTLPEASEVQPDEILIVPVIDIGWTPVFATIAGFASDVGSTLSHGAVVAREYGIPVVVNLRNASRTFNTGDYVELDADHGVLRRIAENAAKDDESVSRGGLRRQEIPVRRKL
jgi:phosphohistidine swiveling domain-containing protein